MSNGVGKPGEDIKKYDLGFLSNTPTEPEGSSDTIDTSNITNIPEGLSIGSSDVFNLDFSEEEKKQLDEYNAYNEALAKQQEKEAQIDYDMSGVEKAGRSLLAGLGDVFDGIGDAIDFVTDTPDTRVMESELYKELYGEDLNKPLSDWFHEVGADMQSFGDRVPGLEDMSGVTWSSMLEPEFWTTHFARALPFTLSFFIPGIAGARGANYLYKGLSMLSKGEKSFRAGRALAATGLVGAEKGSKIARTATTFLGGGLAGNMSEGAIIAGQTLNDALEQGVPLEQASVAAADVFRDNLYWFAVDGAQLGIFTGTGNILKGLSKGALRMKAPGMKRFVQQMSQVTGYALTDAMLEQFQEVYQDWAMKTRIAEQNTDYERGTFSENVGNYLDYFLSQEALPTRVIAFTSSLVVTGGKTALDVSAERKKLFQEEMAADGLFQERLDILDQEVEDYDMQGQRDTPDRATAKSAAMELEAMKSNQFFAYMIRRVAQNKGDYIKDFLTQKQEEGKMTKAELDTYLNSVKELEEVKKLAPDFGLNTNESSRLLEILFNKNENKKEYERQKEKLENDKAIVNESDDLSLAAKKKQVAGLDNELDNLEQSWKSLQQNTKSEVDNIMTESAKRRQNERIQKEVVPLLKDVLAKQEQNQPLNEEDSKLVSENQEVYDKLKQKERRRKADRMVTNKHKYIENVEEGNNDIIYQRELKPDGKFRVYEEVRIDENGNMKTTKHTTLDIIKSSEETLEARQNNTLAVEDILNKEQDKTALTEEEKKIKADNQGTYDKIKAQRQKEKEEEQEKKDKESKPKTKEEIQKAAETRRLKKAKMFFGKDKYGRETLTRGQRKVWADEFRKENPDSAVFWDNNLTDEHGHGVQGQAIGLSMFINPDLATQEVFVHEKWHVYQQLFAGSKEMKALLKEVIKQPVYNKVKNQHHVKIKYSKNGVVSMLSQILFDNPSIKTYEQWKIDSGFKQTGDAAYTAYMNYVAPLLKEKGYKQLADSKQDALQNEALATAGGIQDASNTEFFRVGKDESKFQKGMKAAWKLIKSSISKKSANNSMQENFPSWFSNDFGDMLNSAREEFSKPDKQRSYESYKRINAPFYLKTAEESFAKSSIEQSLVANNDAINSRVEQVVNNFLLGRVQRPDVYDQQEMIENLFSNKASFLSKILADSKTGLNEEQKALIDEYYNKNAADVDNLLGGFYLESLNEIIQDKFEYGEIDEEELGQFQEETETAFGKIISEDFSRKVNERVANLVNEFLTEEYNVGKTGKSIRTKGHVYEALEKALRGTKYDFDLFKNRIELVVDNARKNKKEDADLTTDELLAEFIIYAENNMRHPGDVTRSMWNYFRSFTLEKANQWVVSADGKVSLQQSIPIRDARSVRNYTESAIEKLRDGENYTDNVQVVFTLEMMRKNNTIERNNKKIYTRNNAIVQFMKKFHDEWNNKSFTYDDIKDLRIEGKKLSNFFTEEKIDELQSALLNIDYDYYLNKGKKYWENHRDNILNAVPVISNNLQYKEVLREVLKKDYEKYVGLTDSQKKEANFNRIIYVQKDNKAFLKSYKNNFKSIYRELYTELYNTMYYFAGYNALSGMTKNAAGDTVELFNKTSYVHKNIENLMRILPTMSQERFDELFGDNAIARLMREQGAGGRYAPELVISLGLYNEGQAKGKKNSQLTAQELTNARMMHLIDSIRNNNDSYNHFIGQLGDSSRQYYIGNAPLWGDTNIKSSIDGIQKTLGKKADIKNNAERLFNQLFKAGHITEDTPAMRDAVTKAVKINYINKFYFSDLYYNRVNAQTAYDVDSKGKVKNFIEDLSKRVKGISSPLVSLHGKRIEPIIIKDPRIDGVQLADSASYMLPQHVRMMKIQYGEFDDIGSNLKTIYYGQNLDNTTFEEAMKGKTVSGTRIPLYFKTHTHALTGQAANKHKNLKYIQDVLKYRAAILGPNVIPVVYFDSSIKGGLLPGQIDKMSYTIEEIKEISDKINNNEPTGDSFNNKQDELYKFVDEDGIVQYGFDGDNFGIQNKLDNRNKSSIMSKQYMSNLMVLNTVGGIKGMNSTGEGVLARLNNLLGEIKAAQVEEKFVQNSFENMYNQRVEDLYSWIDGKAVEEFGPHFMGNEQFYNNVVASYVKKNIFQTRFAGTLSTEMTDIAYNYKIGEENTKTSGDLKTYREEDGVIKVAEIVISKSLAKEHNVKVGDMVFAARIPNSKIGDGLVLQVKEIMSNREGNAVIIPSVHGALIGSDKDGDQLHIAVLNKKSNLSQSENLKNEFLNLLFELYQQPEVQDLILQEVEFDENITKKGLDHIRKTHLTEKERKEFDRIKDDLLIMDEQDIQDRFIGNSVMLGIVASLNRSFNYFASGLGAIRSTNQTTIRYKEGKPINIGIKNRQGKQEYLGVVSNLSDNKDKIWLSYAQFLNFIIDDGKFGNRAKFRMQEESANHFAFMLRMGLSLETVLDVMYDPLYVEYMEAFASGMSKSQALSEVTMFDNIDRSVETVTSSFSLDLNSGLSNNLNGFTSLIVALDSFGKEMRILQQFASLDQKLPANYFESYVLQRQVDEVMANQVDIARKFMSNGDLISQAKAFKAYMNNKLEESIITESDASIIYNNLKNTFDFSEPKNVQFLYNALRYNKMAVYLKPDALQANDGLHKGLTFQDLLFNYSTIKQDKFEEIKGKYKGRQQLEELYKEINDNAYNLISQYSGNGFIDLLKVRKDRKTFRNYADGRTNVVKFYNSINVDKQMYNAIQTDENIKLIREEFLQLPAELQNYFITYEFYNNKFGAGTGNTFLMFLPKNVRSEVKRASDFIEKNKTKNNIQKEMYHANELFTGGYKFFTEEFVDKIDGDIKDETLVLFRMAEILKSFSVNKFMDALNSFAGYTKPMANNTYVKYNENGTKTSYQLQSPIISKLTEKEIEKEKKQNPIKSKGKILFKISYKVFEQDESGKTKITNESYIVRGDNNLNELDAILTYSGAIQSNYNKLKNEGTFYLKSEDQSSFAFDNDIMFSEEAFAKERGYISSFKTLGDLQVDNPEAYTRFKKDYDEWSISISKVKNIREQLYKDGNVFREEKDDEGNQIPFTTAQNLMFANKQLSTLTDYFNRLVDLHPLAKNNLAQEIQYLYGAARSNEQETYWRKTPAGRALMDKATTEQRFGDISVVDMFMSPGDMGQYHPTIASVRRNLERGNQLMHRDLKRMTEELNEAYNNLYKSKYGLLTIPTKFVSRMPVLRLLKSTESVSDKLFENILVRKSRIKRFVEGKEESIKHESVHRLNSAIFNADNSIKSAAVTKMIKDGLLSKEEAAYAGVVSRYTQFYNQLAKSKGLYTKDRKYYSPLADSSYYEVLRKRGIYGVYYKFAGRAGDASMVKIRAYNPLSGKEEVKPLKDFLSIYSATKEEVQEFLTNNPHLESVVKLSDFTQSNRILKTAQLTSLAKGYLDQGRDVLGNEIVSEEGANQVITTESKTMNRYLSERSHRAEYLASGNLQYAMYNYVKTMVFQHGTEFFDGSRYNRIEFFINKNSTNKKRESRLLLLNSASTMSSKELARKAKNKRYNMADELRQRYAVPNFGGFEAYKFEIGAGMTFLEKNPNKISQNAVRYMKETMLEAFVMQRPKQTITPFPELERSFVNFFVNLTMRVGLGINTTAAAYNILIGKYNAWRSQGTVKFAKAHMRWMGVSNLTGLGSFRQSRKTRLLLEEFGILTYRPEEQLEGAKFDTYLDKILFYPMVSAERFIQEVQFLGELTDEQWNAYDLDENNNLIVVDPENVLSIDDVARKQRKVQNMQGRGYSAIDQRMMQTYVLGAAVLQFKRWFPTFLSERLGKGTYIDYIDDFGEIYTGTLKAFATEDGKIKLKKYVDPLHYTRFYLDPNLWNPSAKSNNQYQKDGLTLSQTQALQRLHRGMTGLLLVAGLLAASEDDERIKKLLADMALLTNAEKIKNMIIMPAFSTFLNLYYLVISLVTQEEYKRDSKYGLKGDPKYKRWGAALTPNLSYPFAGKDDDNLKTFIWGAPAKRGQTLRKFKRKKRERKNRYGRN